MQGQHGCRVDVQKSIHYLTLAADQGHTQALFQLAVCLKDGQGVQENKIRSLYYFKAAAAKGHTESQYQTGLLLQSNEHHEAYTYFLQAVASNHLAAEYECIKYQIASDTDLSTCFLFCEHLVGQGSTEIQFILARLLETGLTGRQNCPKAYRYYTKLLGTHSVAKFHYTVLAESTAGALDTNKLKENYEACMSIHPKAKFYLARLLLKSECNESEARKAIALIEQYFPQALWSLHI